MHPDISLEKKSTKSWASGLRAARPKPMGRKMDHVSQAVGRGSWAMGHGPLGCEPAFSKTPFSVTPTACVHKEVDFKLCLLQKRNQCYFIAVLLKHNLKTYFFKLQSYCHPWPPTIRNSFNAHIQGVPISF